MSIETYYTGGVSKVTHPSDSEEGKKLLLDLQASFPWVLPEHYFSVSEPSWHEVLQDDVVTCCLPMRLTEKLVGPGYALSNRKFCMSGKTSFLRLYKIFDDAVPTWMPASAKVLFVGENHEEFGRPYNPLANNFHDLYFSGPAADIEAAFNLPVHRGAYDTFYGVTVVDGHPARVKQYVYEEQVGFSDWDVVWLIHAKRTGLIDKVLAGTA